MAYQELKHIKKVYFGPSLGEYFKENSNIIGNKYSKTIDGAASTASKAK